MAESEGEVVGLIDEVVAWLATEDPTPLAILGGYGAGKSSFAKRLVTQQAAQALTDPSARRPILIKLGGLSRYSDLEGFLGAMLTSQHNVRGYRRPCPLRDPRAGGRSGVSPDPRKPAPPPRLGGNLRLGAGLAPAELHPPFDRCFRRTKPAHPAHSFNLLDIADPTDRRIVEDRSVEPGASADRDDAGSRSGRAALAEFGLTTTTDDDRLVPAVRLLRPDQHQVTPEKTFEESAWAQTDEAAWRAVWDAEVAATDPWRTRRLTLATGLLLPIWGRLPSKGCSVRRVRAPDGRRWLGRVLDEVQAASLKTALGLTEVGDAWADGGRTAAAVLDRNVQLALSGGLWLKRSRVMDRWRLEVVGGRTDRDALVSLGCFVEIIAYAPRVFVPVDRPDVVEGVLRRHPVQSILEGAAA